MAPQDSFIDDEEDTWYVLLPDPARSSPAGDSGEYWVPELTDVIVLSASRSLISQIEISDHALADIKYGDALATSYRLIHAVILTPPP